MPPEMGQRLGSEYARRRVGASANPEHVAIRVAHRFNAPSKRVFDAWLDAKTAGQWLFATASHPMTDVTIDARTGGSFCIADGNGVEYSGKYNEIVPHGRLVFTLFVGHRRKIATRVAVEIDPLKKGCTLALHHANLPPDYAPYAEARWTGILYGLGVPL